MHSHRPVWHCLAFAGVWYAALVLLNAVVGGEVVRTATIGVVPWLGASVALMRFSAVKAWRLVLLGLPIFYLLWAVSVAVASGFLVPVTG
ncbi:hypothetical protein [Lentzea sp. NPDC059081]|uniref:hypothetical protein n=1 Tax=Lentzea sp. NPDC059081 TaxID=3346719 RepID=UPI0036C45603